MTEEKEVFIQIGVTALRDPFGNFLPAEPLYKKINQPIEKSGLTKAEENLVHDVSGFFADQYNKVDISKKD